MSVAGLHPEATCEECGRPNVTWFAPSDLWNVAVDGDRGLILCPVCFVVRAEARGIKPTAWIVQPESGHVYPCPQYGVTTANGNGCTCKGPTS